MTQVPMEVSQDEASEFYDPEVEDNPQEVLEEEFPVEETIQLVKFPEELSGYERPNRSVDYSNGIIEDGVIKPLILTNGGKHPKDIRVAGERYSDEKKLEVVTIYLSTQSRQETSNISGVPLQTVNTWMKAKWWNTACSKVRTLDKSKKLTKLSRIVNQALDVVADRIEHGDYTYDQRTGEVRRIPMSAKNAITASTQLIDRFLIINKAFEEKQVDSNVGDKLNQLADAFTKFAQSKGVVEPKQEPIEAEFTEV